nr:hypothetical protein [Tanacetum cinerariifolium]
MENTNPPPTSNHPILPAALRAQAVQELHELQIISAFVDSRLESIERFLNNFANQPNETNMNDLESNDESVDTLVKDIKEKDKIKAKTEQNQEQTGSVEKSKVKPDKIKA